MMDHATCDNQVVESLFFGALIRKRTADTPLLALGILCSKFTFACILICDYAES